MADQFIQVDCPLKGISRAMGREVQPPGTCYDALNVLPSDRWGRLRIAVRTGLGLLTTVDAAAPLHLLHVASSARTSTGGAASIFSDPFTYSNGNLGAVSGSIWTAYDNSFVAAAGNLKIVSNKVFTNTGDGAGVVTTTPAVGSIYSVSVDFVVNEVGNALYLAIPTRMNPAARATQRLSVLLNLRATTPTVKLVEGTGANSIVPDTGSAGATLANGFFVVGQTYTTKIAWSGNTFIVYINGVQQFTGTTTLYSTFTGLGFLIQASTLNSADNFAVVAGLDANANLERTALTLVAVAGAKTYAGTPTALTAVSNTGTYPIDATHPYVSAATLFGYTYILDGSNIRRLRLSDNTFVAFTESAGTAPLGHDIAAAWRGRLVIAGDDADAQNFYASRAGDPLDWNTGATDAAAAFAGNTAASGKVGQPIHALIPMSDDILIIGQEQSIYAMRGDPADGGSIDLVSDGVGISSSTSWVKAADGSVYFIGPRGFFKLDPTATTVTEISQNSYPQFFQGINRSTSYISLVYDPDRYGVWVLVTPVTQGTAGSHIFYDLRNGGLWPQRFTNLVAAGPIVSSFWDGYGSDTRYPLFGGYAGGLYAMNLTNKRDEGGAIDSMLVLGPFHPATGDAILTGAIFNMGEVFTGDDETDFNANVEVKAGKTAYDVTQGTASASYAVNIGEDRRPKTIRQRVRGEWFSANFTNSQSGDYWSFESAQLEFNPLGRNRRRL